MQMKDLRPQDARDAKCSSQRTMVHMWWKDRKSAYSILERRNSTAAEGAGPTNTSHAVNGAHNVLPKVVKKMISIFKRSELIFSY